MTKTIFLLLACVFGCGSPTITPTDGGEIHDAPVDQGGSPQGDASDAQQDAAADVTGIMIPLYTYPTDGTWAAVIQARAAHPKVPILAVINPNSGPGTSKSSDYATGIGNLQTAGVTVIGYVPTGYAKDQ